MSFYDLKLRKNAMALLSKVTVVVKPSPQPETPAPMTGTPLPVLEKYEYLDPPDNSNQRTSVFAMIVNPRPYYPTSGDIESDPPEIIFRASNYGFTEEKKSDNELRITEPSSFSLRANNVVLTGATGVSSMGVVAAATVPAISSKIELLSSRGTYKTDLLLVSDGNQNNIFQYMENAENTMAKNTDINSMKGMFDLYGGLALYETRVLHAWVMCGNGYVLLDNGELYKTNDGFTTTASLFAAINTGLGDIMRNHPGIVAYTQSDYDRQTI